MSTLLRNTNILDIPVHRTATNNGIIIAVMGTDGSGKSTQTRRIRSLLSEKIDVIPIYMGSGDGSASTLRYTIEIVLRVMKRCKSFMIGVCKRVVKERNESDSQPRGRRRKNFSQNGSVRLIWEILWSGSLALEKVGKLKRAGNARSNGMVVVCDRYPQTTCFGFNDGPLLQRYAQSSSVIMRWIAEWEFRTYSYIDQVPPDVVIKLIGDSEVIHSRRTEMEKTRIIEKQDGVFAVTYPKSVDVREVDATRPTNDVTIEVMNIIREKLSCDNSHVNI